MWFRKKVGVGWDLGGRSTSEHDGYTVGYGWCMHDTTRRIMDRIILRTSSFVLIRLCVRCEVYLFLLVVVVAHVRHHSTVNQRAQLHTVNTRAYRPHNTTHTLGHRKKEREQHITYCNREGEQHTHPIYSAHLPTIVKKCVLDPAPNPIHHCDRTDSQIID